MFRRERPAAEEVPQSLAREAVNEEEHKLFMLRSRMKHMDFEKYEYVFRRLSRNPRAKHDYELRMTHKSLKNGLKFIYAGKPNDVLSDLIFSYFNKGFKNAQVKFSSFMYHFVAEIDLDSVRLNHLVFKMLDDDKDDQLRILDLVRIYVSLPKTSAFAAELRSILRFYLEKSIKPKQQFVRQVEYNFSLFKTLGHKSLEHLVYIHERYLLSKQLMALPYLTVFDLLCFSQLPCFRKHH